MTERRVRENESERASFELDRVERGEDDRIEIRGRWSGVRGRRFVRPSLTAIADGEIHRSLATLEHKPWHPTDGEIWVAAFEWTGDEAALEQAELAVAPDIAISLQAATGGRGRLRSNGATSNRRKSTRPANDSKRSAPARRSAAHAELSRLRDERDDLAGELDKQRVETDRLRAELDAANAAKLEASSALARRDALIGKLEEVTSERDRLRVERDAEIAAREAQRLEQHDAIETEVQQRLSGLRSEIERERHAAGRMARAARERDAARADRDTAVSERDAAREARDAATRERDEARAERDRLAGDLDAALSAAGRNRAAITHARRAISSGGRNERTTDWAARARGMSPLLVFVIVLIVLVRTT